MPLLANLVNIVNNKIIKLGDKGIMELSLVNMLHEADRPINAPQPKATPTARECLYTTRKSPKS